MAGSRDLKLRLLLEDKATGQFKKVDASLEGTGAKFSKFARVASAAMVGVASSAVADFVKQMDSLATTGEAVQRRFDTVFGEMSSTVAKWVDDQNEAFGLSQTALKSLAAGVQDLLVPLGFSRDAAAAMTEQTLTLANALSEWTGGQVDVESAVDRIRKALLGEREGMKELGVAISEADVKAQLLKDGTDQLTGAALDQAKAQATLEIILNKSADALSAYADGADSALRKNKELNATTSDLKDELARFLKPTLDEGRGVLTDYADALRTLNNTFGDSTGAASGAGQAFGSFIGVILDNIPYISDVNKLIRQFNDELERLTGQTSEPYGMAHRMRTPSDTTDIQSSSGHGNTVFPNATFNIEGSWDFSDPSAARTFVRRLDRELSAYRLERN